jgi:hypothetical protein
MTVKTGSKKEAQERIALQEIELSISRFKTLNEKKWWLELSAEDQMIFGKLLGRIATVAQGVEAKSEPKFKAPLMPMLESLSNWVVDMPKLNPNIEKTSGEIKEKLDKKITRLETLAALEVTPPGEPKPKNSSSNNGDPKLINKIIHIESKLEEIHKQINFNLSVSRNMAEQEGTHSEENKGLHQVSQKAIADQVIYISNFNERYATVIRESMVDASNNLKNLENKFKAFESQLAIRMHIRDSVQILEIKEEVERFVVSDLIRKISLAIMPAIEALKDAKSEEIPKAIDDLSVRCTNAGLIPIERLFS